MLVTTNETVTGEMAIFKIIAGLIGALAVRPSMRIPLPARPMPGHISPTDQWQILTGTLTQAISRAEQARLLQSSATRQLDLAQYGLSTLMDELATVMTVPARRTTAMVHRFEPLASRTANQALAA